MLRSFNNCLTLAFMCAATPCVFAAESTTTLPTVTVTGPAPATSVSEDALVGPYQQPEWTEHRRFTTTRVYIQQEPWEIGFEQWWRARAYDNSQPAHRFSEELEIGLPHRFQLDFYWNWAHDEAGTHHDEYSVELRYALADWGKIWGNPTLYLEYAFVNHDFGGDTLESKVLFGDDFGQGWHWGLNFIFESELSLERSKEVSISGGLSRTIIDSVLSAGFEWQWRQDTVAGQRGDPEIQFEIGPSLQWRIGKNAHLDLVGLFGTTGDGPKFESFVVFGWDFGGVGGQRGYTPASASQN
jgi:hypothetical protein